ncbi:MAG: DUF1015 domain-containing protein [Synergistaceae bacterium]|nr:DUF1015 domain-containing protein [Candidatus Equadaptatus faecalis]
MIFDTTNILLPNKDADLQKWAVIACDQYTSQPEYWKEVESLVGDAPSALKLTLPEIYLGEAEKLTEEINENMKKYLADGTLTEAVKNGFIYVERQTSAGVLPGLLGALDLEEYDFREGTKPKVRATEDTILSRIPPREKIRENAVLELPHVLLLLDDAEKQLIEPLAAQKNSFRKLYDFDLMQNGGHVAGWAVEGEAAEKLRGQLAELEEKAGEIFLATGDGNHSVATAKSCWEKLKAGLSPKEIENHPARRMLAEIVNLHSDAIVFQPIHRVLFGIKEDIVEAFERWLELNGMSLMEGSEITFTFANGGEEEFAIDGRGKLMPLAVMQKWLDKYVAKNKYLSLDYVHGRANVDKIVSESGAVGIIFNAMDKAGFFPAIKAGGALPKKTFSIGNADDKRFYLEARKIR